MRRISTTYDVRGLVQKITSYDNTVVGSGTVQNEVQFAYNDFRQLVTSWQAHAGAVNTSMSPKLEYAYAGGSDNTVRPASLTYPDGRVVTYNYGTGGGMDDATSRVNKFVDSDGGSTELAQYTYLGLGFVKQVQDIELTVIKVNDNVPVYVKDVAEVTLGPQVRRGVLDKGGADAVGGLEAEPALPDAGPSEPRGHEPATPVDDGRTGAESEPPPPRSLRQPVDLRRELMLE